MFSLDKGLSRSIDKYFAIGFMFPVAIGIIVIVLLLKDISPFSELYLQITDAQSSSASLLLRLSSVSIGAVWIFAIVLHLINDSLLNMLEGYFGPFNRTRWRAQMIARYNKEKERQLTLYQT